MFQVFILILATQYLILNTMYQSVTEIRVRYGETDQMGFVYYGNYPLYYEEGRTDAIRKLGISYKELEASGIMLPVAELNIRYKAAALYDEVLTVKTSIKQMPNRKMIFHTDIFNANGEWLNTGETTLLFMRTDTRSICTAPKEITEALGKYFETKGQ